MDWQRVYEAYPVNRHLIWLNNCGTVPAGSHVVEAMTRFVTGYAEQGVLTDKASFGGVRRKILSILSGLLGCEPAELALIHNTAEGMNFISHGLPLKAGDEIVLLENEYPSNVYPWRHWTDKGVRLRTAPMGDTPDAFLDGLNRHLGDRTRVVAVSAVHWCTGMPLPLDRIGAMCRQRDIAFVVDGAQGVGMQPMDVNRAHISYMAFSAWKWLMGPLGLGVLYIRRDRLDVLKPVFVGTTSVVRDQEHLPYKSELKPGAARFTLSTANFNDWVYFLSALEFLAAIGFETVRKRLMHLSGHLAGGLGRIGWQVVSDRFPEHPTAIVACEKTGVSSGDVMARLASRGIVATERLGRIRLAPHIYNTSDQLNEVIRVFDGFA